MPALPLISSQSLRISRGAFSLHSAHPTSVRPAGRASLLDVPTGPAGSRASLFFGEGSSSSSLSSSSSSTSTSSSSSSSSSGRSAFQSDLLF